MMRKTEGNGAVGTRLRSACAWMAAALLATTLLTACGGGGGDSAFSSTSASTSVAATVASIAVTSSAASIPADGSGSVTLTATALNASNVAVQGAKVTFTATAGGSVTVTSGTTNASGVATATLASNGAAAGSTITVTAAIGSVTGSKAVSVVSAGQTVTVSTSSPQMTSSGSSPATITAYVRSSTNQLLTGVPVSFTATSGGLQGTNPTVTGPNGTASVVLTTAGDPTNRTITVTATAGSSTQSVNVGVTGTTITLSGPSSLIQGGAAGTYNISLVDSGGTPISNRAVTVASSAGNTITPASFTTNTGGVGSFTLKAVNSATTDTLTVTAMGATATQKVTVSNQSFSFTAASVTAAASPVPILTVAPAAPSTAGLTPVSVTWTTTNGPVVNSQVTFATTRGFVSAASNPYVFGPSATATTDATGTALVYVYATTAGPGTITASGTASGSTVSAQLPLNFVATNPTTLVLQATPATIPTQGTSTISAVLTDANGNPVAGQTLAFQDTTDNTGGSLSAGSAVTNAQGVAQTVYTATSLSSGYQGVTITGSVPSTSVPNAIVKLTVGGQSVNLSLGTGIKLGENTTQTQFILPYSILAVDAAGNPVAGAVVTLNIQTTAFIKGFWTVQGNAWSQSGNISAVCGVGQPQVASIVNVPVVSPATVTTDATGSATFSVVYPEDHAAWVQVLLSATTQVSGSQSTATASFVLQQLATYVNAITSPVPGQTSPYGVDTVCSDLN